MTTPIRGLKATTVHVKDITKARAFYSKTLGLRETGYDPKLQAAYYEIPGATTALGIHLWGPMCNEHNGGRAPGTISGTIFTVDNVEKAAAELKAKGVTVTDPAAKTPFGAMATIADPDGNEFVLSQP